tara:strand:- start:1247 stop:2320 length:1074 start_codon:yes stop_codon:yes gene_type:complete
MAFLDNTGDIILDAVLTDTGRKRLAQGDGSFRIVKFALGDDEIDYSLYRNSNNAAGRHPSGSAYYDLNILQTPVLEAFTNNTSLMKSKLVSYSRNDLLYLPVIKLNDGNGPSKWAENTITNNSANSFWTTSNWINGGYLMSADATTSTAIAGGTLIKDGIKYGNDGNANSVSTQSPLIFEQGLDTANLTVRKLSPGDLRRETQYLLEVDNRLIKIFPGATPGGSSITPAFIDDDNIASYFISYNSDAASFFEGDGSQIPVLKLNSDNPSDPADKRSVMGNPRTNTGGYGLRFGFRIGSSDSIKLGTKLFTEFGRTVTGDLISDADAAVYYVIDTTVRVTGFTTGYRVDVPIRIVKKQ